MYSDTEKNKHGHHRIAFLHLVYSLRTIESCSFYPSIRLTHIFDLITKTLWVLCESFQNHRTFSTNLHTQWEWGRLTHWWAPYFMPPVAMYEAHSSPCSLIISLWCGLTVLWLLQLTGEFWTTYAHIRSYVIVIVWSRLCSINVNHPSYWLCEENRYHSILSSDAIQPYKKRPTV